MKNEDFQDNCSPSYTSHGGHFCWISGKAHDRIWTALWPQKLDSEKSTSYYTMWDFYVEWGDSSRGRVNQVTLCHKHSDRLWRLWGEVGAEEVATSDATERWAISRGGRI
jgi:hypothetical protein